MTQDFAMRGWLDRLIVSLPRGASILDIGCGAGEPVARYLHDHDFRLTGVDASAVDIALARTRFPRDSWICGNVATVAIDGTFDAVLAWDALRQITGAQRAIVLTRIAGWLKPGARGLLTGVAADGETLEALGLRALLKAPDGGGMAWLVQKAAA